MQITLDVNGEDHELDVEPRRLLADVLRQQLGLFGVHLGCEHGVCGACGVRLDGVVVRSCLMFAVQAEGHSIVTIEGTADDLAVDATREAFKAEHGLQCGFCTPAFVLAAAELVEADEDMDEATIREELSGNICRCTGYQGIVSAVQRARENHHDQRAEAVGGEA